MAKTGAMGPLIGALFNSVTPKGQDKKRARKPKPNATTLGEKSVTEPGQQHGELGSYKEPTPAERTRNHARDAKVRATQDWVDGRISSKQHANIHERANHVLNNRNPREYKGPTGERAPKGRLAW
jgi:hypothetical protein